MSESRKEMQETNGALPPAPETPRETSKEVAKPAPISPKMPHQTHGAVLPNGPITSVDQLIRGRSVASTTPGAFDTLQDYTKYLSSLSLASLHRHALEDAKMVPIDNRDRLIRRLEGEWSTAITRTPGRARPVTPQPKPYTAEQTAKLDEIRDKLLKRR